MCALYLTYHRDHHDYVDSGVIQKQHFSLSLSAPFDLIEGSSVNC